MVHRHLFVLNDRPNHDLLDSERNWLQLELLLPDQTIQFDLVDDLLPKSVEIRFCAPWLDLPQNNRLGNWRSFLGLLLVGCSLLEGLFGFLVLRDTCKWVEAVIRV